MRTYLGSTMTSMTKITIEESDDWFVITDEETGVTTQGKTKIEALLMLADALALHEGVLEGIEDIAEGRTMSAEDLDDVLKEPEQTETRAGMSLDELDPELTVLVEIIGEDSESGHATIHDPDPFDHSEDGTEMALKDALDIADGFCCDCFTRAWVEMSLQDDVADYDVEVSDESKAELAEAAQEAGLSDDQKESLEEVKRMISENADAGKPLLRPPLEKDEIEEIDDEELRALAWDLGAIATAYNYATDPTMPDLAREDARTWIRGKEKIRLEEACSLLKEAYDRLYDRVGDDLEPYRENPSGSDTK